MAASQQAQWLAASLPQFAPIWESTDKQNALWALCFSFTAPAEQSLADVRPFMRIPGIGEGKWASENVYPSRTAALRASKRMAKALDDNATEKGHMAVWACKLSKAEFGRFLRLFAGMEAEAAAAFIAAGWNGEIFCSVLPLLKEEEFRALIAAPKPKAARKPKKQAEAAPEAAPAIEAAPEAEIAPAE